MGRDTCEDQNWERSHCLSNVRMEGVQESKPLGRRTKVQVFCPVAMSVLVNGAETWGATNLGTTETEETPVVHTPAEDAKQSATEATVMVQTDRKEEDARMDLFVVGGCHQQKPN